MEKRFNKVGDYDCPIFSYWTKTNDEEILKTALNRLSRNLNIKKDTPFEKECFHSFDRDSFIKFTVGFYEVECFETGNTRTMYQFHYYNKSDYVSIQQLGNFIRNLVDQIADILEIEMKQEQKRIENVKIEMFIRNKLSNNSKQ